MLIVSDAISGVAPYHLEEATRMGVVSAPSSDVIDYLASDRGRGRITR